MSGHADPIRKALDWFDTEELERTNTWDEAKRDALAALDALVARCDALENALREIAEGTWNVGSDDRIGFRAYARAALAATDTTREPKMLADEYVPDDFAPEFRPPPAERQET